MLSNIKVELMFLLPFFIFYVKKKNYAKVWVSKMMQEIANSVSINYNKNLVLVFISLFYF